MTAMGAANHLLIPIEASTKGVNSLLRTLEMQQQLEEIGAFNGKVLGIIPFRDRWFGRSQSTDSRESIEAMREIATDITVFPSILESEQYKKAVRMGIMLSDAGFPELEYPLLKVIDEL